MRRGGAFFLWLLDFGCPRHKGVDHEFSGNFVPFVAKKQGHYSHPPPTLDTRNSSRIRVLSGRVTGVTCSLLGYDGSKNTKIHKKILSRQYLPPVPGTRTDHSPKSPPHTARRPLCRFICQFRVRDAEWRVMHSVHRTGGMSVNSTTPSGCACHPSGGGEFWVGYPPPLEEGPKGGVVVGGSIAVIFIMPIPDEGNGMAVNASTNAQRGAKKEGTEKLPFAHQTGYNCYETGRSINGRSGPFRRHLRTWPHSVISSFLECV